MLHYFMIHRHKLKAYGPVHLDLLQRMGCKAAENAQPTILSQTIRIGLKIDEFVFLAALKGCSLEICEMLWRTGLEIPNLRWWIDYALLRAISACNYQLTEFWLRRGANPNSTVVFNGHRPLALAAAKGSEPILVHLMELGAVVGGRRVFEAAAEHGQSGIIRALIWQLQLAERRQKADPTPKRNQLPILQAAPIKQDMINAMVLATEAGDEAVIEVLLAYGSVDPTGKDAKGRSALQVAKSKGFVRIVSLFKEWLKNFAEWKAAVIAYQSSRSRHSAKAHGQRKRNTILHSA